MRIVTIEPSPKNPSRQRLRFEDGSVLTLSADTVAQFYLCPGKALDAAAFEEIVRGDERHRVRKRAMGILGHRAKSRKELIDRLIEKGESREASEAAAHWLEEIRLLDDGNYAGEIVRHYAARGYGKLRIQQELYRRGIEKELWDTAFEEMPENPEAVDRFIQSKLRGGIPDRKEEKRVADALYRRGHAWDEIAAALRRYREELED